MKNDIQLEELKVMLEKAEAAEQAIQHWMRIGAESARLENIYFEKYLKSAVTNYAYMNLDFTLDELDSIEEVSFDINEKVFYVDYVEYTMEEFEVFLTLVVDLEGNIREFDEDDFKN